MKWVDLFHNRNWNYIQRYSYTSLVYVKNCKQLNSWIATIKVKARCRKTLIIIINSAVEFPALEYKF